MKDFNSKVLIKKYQPNNLEELILPDRILEKLYKGPYQDFLFYGSPGNGKTSTAWAICKHFDLPYLYINASDETSVDIIRSKITNFCSTADIMGGKSRIKIVILDEIDGVSDQFFKALKGTMDKFKNNSRFIATTNFINVLPKAVLSRFEVFDFDFNAEESKKLEIKYMKRLYEICKAEGIGIDKQALVEFVKIYFPDFRSILNKLNGFIYEGIDKITLENIKAYRGLYKDIFELIFSTIDPVVNYKLLVSEYANRTDDVLAVLGNEFIEYIETDNKEAIKYIPQIIISVAQHQHQRVHVIDPVITMLSLVFSLQSIINGA
jgi:DNA polymerase III delta prime subunit